MARVEIPVTRTTPAGVNPAEVTGVPADDHTFENDGHTLLVIRNSGAGPITVDIVTAAEVEDLAIADNAVVVAAGETHFSGPFKPGVYNQADGTVYVNVASADAKLRALSV